MAGVRARKSLNRKTAYALHALYHLNKEQRNALLKTADKQLVKGICECALNTLKGCIDLKNNQKKKLLKYRKILRTLADKNKKSWKVKKRLIIQKGSGFLTLLLEPIITTVLSKLIELN